MILIGLFIVAMLAVGVGAILLLLAIFALDEDESE